MEEDRLVVVLQTVFGSGTQGLCGAVSVVVPIKLKPPANDAGAA